MIAVPYFEKALYELPEDQLTKENILRIADEIEEKIQGGFSGRPLMSVPHILADESSAYFTATCSRRWPCTKRANTSSTPRGTSSITRTSDPSSRPSTGARAAVNRAFSVWCATSPARRSHDGVGQGARRQRRRSHQERTRGVRQVHRRSENIRRRQPRHAHALRARRRSHRRQRRKQPRIPQGDAPSSRNGFTKNGPRRPPRERGARSV